VGTKLKNRWQEYKWKEKGQTEKKIYEARKLEKTKKKTSEHKV